MPTQNGSSTCSRPSTYTLAQRTSIAPSALPGSNTCAPCYSNNPASLWLPIMRNLPSRRPKSASNPKGFARSIRRGILPSISRSGRCFGPSRSATPKPETFWNDAALLGGYAGIYRAFVRAARGRCHPGHGGYVTGAPSPRLQTDIFCRLLGYRSYHNVGRFRLLASVMLELGDKSPAFVERSSKLNAAAELLTWGQFANKRQTCTVPGYLYMHEHHQG